MRRHDRCFKILHNYYDSSSVVKLAFYPFRTTRVNEFKLQKRSCYYNIRKYSFGSPVINIWNSSPDYVEEADCVNSSEEKRLTLTVLTPSRIVSINTGLIKMLFMIINQT